MLRKDQTEVLVVGAGPVGLLTALLLGEAGIQVKIIDEEERTATHSYACALHQPTIAILQRAGLGPEALQLGYRIEKMAFYEGNSCRAELDFPKAATDFPFVLVMPQSGLEELLQRALAQKATTKVSWNHRLSDLPRHAAGVTAMIDHLYETVTGYIVPHWEWVVKNTTETHSAFLVGADGHNSLVRQRLGIQYERLEPAQVFAVYEFEGDKNGCREVRVALGEKTTDVLWPLSGNRYRWSFQLNQTEEFIEFPRKDRTSVEIEEKPVEEELQKQLRKFIMARAPWFDGNVTKIDWFTLVQFEHRLTTRFGEGRCWLAGDAAHQTGPVGMQSLNVGMREAAELARILIDILREQAPVSLLDSYNAVFRREWLQLLGRRGSLKATDRADSWAKSNCERLLPCIPASGEGLARLLDQLGLSLR